MPSKLNLTLGGALIEVVLDNALNGDGVAGLNLIDAVALHLIALDGLIANLDGDGDALVLIVVGLSSQNLTGQLSDVGGGGVLAQVEGILQDLGLVSHQIQLLGGGVGGLRGGAVVATGDSGAATGGGGAIAGGGGGVAAQGTAVHGVDVHQGAAALEADDAGVLAQDTLNADVVALDQAGRIGAGQTNALHQLGGVAANHDHHGDVLGVGVIGGLDLHDVTGDRGGTGHLLAVGQSKSLVQDLNLAQGASHLVQEGHGSGLAALLLDGGNGREQNVGLGHVGQIDQNVTGGLGGADLNGVSSALGHGDGPAHGELHTADGHGVHNVLVLLDGHDVAGLILVAVDHILQESLGIRQGGAGLRLFVLRLVAATGKEGQSQEQDQRNG